MSPLLLLFGLGLGGYLAVWRNKRALKVKARRKPVQTAEVAESAADAATAVVSFLIPKQQKPRLGTGLNTK